MDLMTAAFLSIAITTLSVTIITAVIGAFARTRWGKLTHKPNQARTKYRRQATRVAGVPHSDRLTRPQYPLALARARMWRAQARRPAGATARRREQRSVRAPRAGSVDPALPAGG